MKNLTRRDALRTGAASLVVLVSAGCSKKTDSSLSCTDVSGLSAGDASARAALSYMDRSPDPSKPCKDCQQFVPPPGPSCGTCKLVKGPINPEGTCKAFVKKA